MDPLPQPPEPTAHASPVPRPRPPHLTIVKPPTSGPSLPSPDDLAQWVHAVAQAGDRQAFGRLFTHFAPRVKSFLLRGGTDDELAEELAQETMVMLWRKAALFDARQAAVSTWVFTIARNLRVDRFRRQGGAAALQADDIDMDTLEHGAPPPDEQLHAGRMAEHLRVAMRQLPPEQVQVLQMSYFDDEPHARIASALGIPLGTVKSRVRLAVAHLRRLLDALQEPEK